jgi:hypothetical protein
MKILKILLRLIATNLLILMVCFILLKWLEPIIWGTPLANTALIVVVLLPSFIVSYMNLSAFKIRDVLIFLMTFLLLSSINTALFLRAFVYLTTSNGCYNPWF